jgi:adenylosuccinate synthase
MQRTTAIRVCDLYRREPFAEKVALVAAKKRAVFAALYKDDSTELDAEDICAQFVEMGERIRPFVCDTTALLREAATGGKRILYEGANGTLLDVDHGTYPYVTSSNASALGIHAGAGVHRGMVNTVIGVAKAYATRVGRGPFPTELHDDVGERIRERGREYGTTTGRPRRCGWFDAVAVRYSVELNGVDHVAIMHLDTLAGLKEIGVCVGYEDPGGVECGFGSDAADLAGVRPRYEFLPGWDRDIRNVRRTEELPDTARAFLGRLQELLGVPISMISVGPERDETIIES